MDKDGVSRMVEESFGLEKPSAKDNFASFDRDCFAFAVEQYLREKISHRKLIEIGSKLGIQVQEVNRILEKLGLDEEPVQPLLPAR